MKTIQISAIAFAIIFSNTAIGAPQVTPTDIPSAIRQHEGVGKIRKGFQCGTVVTNAYDKKIYFSWSASAIENVEPDYTLPYSLNDNRIGSHQVAVAHQVQKLRIHPTACCIIDEDTLLVAGLTTSGLTTVQKIILAWPSSMPAPVINVLTGFSSVAAVQPNVSSVTTIYLSANKAAETILNIAAIRVSNTLPSRYIIQYAGSGDVATGEISPTSTANIPLLLASATSTSGSLGQVSSLTGEDQTIIQVREMTGVGNVYILERYIVNIHPVAPSPSFKHYTIFIDSEKDGVIDVPLSLTKSEFDAQGWNNMDNYVDLWRE